MTVMKILAMKARPRLGTTPVSGAIIAPASPANAAPDANVAM